MLRINVNIGVEFLKLFDENFPSPSEVGLKKPPDGDLFLGRTQAHKPKYQNQHNTDGKPQPPHVPFLLPRGFLSCSGENSSSLTHHLLSGV
jgi:hypothetical protein